MTNHQGEAEAPPNVEIKSWWNAFMIGAIIGGGLAAAAAVVTVVAE